MRPRHAILTLLALGGLAACQPTIPDSGAGVGFSNYNDYQAARAERERELAGRAAPTGGVISTESTGGAAASGPEAELASQTLEMLGRSGEAGGTAGGTGSTGTQVAAAAPVAVDTNNPGISDENSFEAVSNRESIEDNAARLAAQRQAYQVIEPTALPARSGENNSNVVQFALSTNNRVGEPIYSRSIIAAQSRYERNCAKYPSPDKAQEAFLARGGPKRDPQGLDPDGDGFACAWDPAPFRLAARG